MLAEVQAELLQIVELLIVELSGLLIELLSNKFKFIELNKNFSYYFSLFHITIVIVNVRFHSSQFIIIHNQKQNMHVIKIE